VTLAWCQLRVFASGSLNNSKWPEDAIQMINYRLAAEGYLRSHGVGLEIVDDSECFELMQVFIQKNDSLWNKDVGV
jgi:hypothetical protein